MSGRSVSGIDAYGLREAKKLIVEQRKALASDPAFRYSRDPYSKGYRDALKYIESHIIKKLKVINDTLTPVVDQ